MFTTCNYNTNKTNQNVKVGSTYKGKCVILESMIYTFTQGSRELDSDLLEYITGAS